MRLINIDAIDYDKYIEKEGYSINDCYRAMQIIEEQPLVTLYPSQQVEMETKKYLKLTFADYINKKMFELKKCIKRWRKNHESL